ncbi:thioesterase II family protein [Colwelliaceae bacterium MEBiC 14330]
MKDAWFIRKKTDVEIKARLFCFPYAGGNSATYSKWQEYLPKNVELILIQPPGRTTRLFEQPFDSMEALVADLSTAITDLLDKPYLFFGHSLGSRVAFELLCQLQSKQLTMPECLIVSGSSAPHLKRDAIMDWQQSDEDFITSLKTLGGTPSEFFEHEELIKLSLPMLRADFKISDLYRAKVIKLPLQFHVLSGTEDHDITEENLLAWQALSAKDITLNYINGGHFYIDKNAQEVLDNIIPIIDKAVKCIEEGVTC